MGLYCEQESFFPFSILKQLGEKALKNMVVILDLMGKTLPFLSIYFVSIHICT